MARNKTHERTWYDFLENWVNKNVTAADRKGSMDRAKELAALCVADAADLGITIDDMEPEWGSVEEIIFDAMQDILGDELVFWKTVAAIRDRRERNETSLIGTFPTNRRSVRQA